jgi:hypothetical protein
MISPDDRYESLAEIIRDIKALSIVSEQPLNHFWNGAIKIAAVAGIIYVLVKLFGD